MLLPAARRGCPSPSNKHSRLETRLVRLTCMRILVIEDEAKAAAYLRQGLAEAGFTVELMTDGESGLRAAEKSEYDLLICDVMLPGRDGFSVVAGLRKSGQRIPILLVTARDQVDDRVRGLDVGADDYIAKPFAFAELLARVRALLRRASSSDADVYRVADLVVEVRRRRVERAGRRIDLTPREFALLLFLLEHMGEVVPRTLITDRVWGMNFDSDTNVLDVQVRRLRAKIDDGAGDPLLHTVRGVGYVLEDRSAAPDQ